MENLLPSARQKARFCLVLIGVIRTFIDIKNLSDHSALSPGDMCSIQKLGLLIIGLLVGAAEAANLVTSIGGGYNHSIFVLADGSVWGMGRDNNAQLGDLGDGIGGDRNRPELIVATGGVAVAVGRGDHNLLLKSDGSLWGWGYNAYGEVGRGLKGPIFAPTNIVSAGVTGIAAGLVHSLFVKSDGSLWVMGDNTYGQLGDGTFTERDTPKRIVASGVVAAAAGDGHSLFLKSNGSLWAMGRNTEGQLGDGTYNSTNLPKQIIATGVSKIAAGSLHSLIIKTDGSLWGMGFDAYSQLGFASGVDNPNSPTKVLANGVVSVAGGFNNSLLIKTDGSAWLMGRAADNQLYTLRKIFANNVVAIAAGGGASVDGHALFAKSDGSLWTMGSNTYGQLGDGFNTDSISPEQVFPAPQPLLRVSVYSKTNLQFRANCAIGGDFIVSGSDDLAAPSSQWTPLSTNSVISRGLDNFYALLNGELVSGSHRFYILTFP
jgi:alpha-tubulin suppressor-like RCC1 family protein